MEIKYCCEFCKKDKFKNLAALNSHKRLCRCNPNRVVANKSYIDKLKTGEVNVWNKGLNADVDERIKKQSETLKQHLNDGIIKNVWIGRHHTEETKRKLALSGGYRKGSGRGKSGWYKGYYCDSSWELAFVIYNIEHDIKFERNRRKFVYVYEGKELKYLPDFILDGKYIEIKGYRSKQWEAKFNQFPKEETLEVLMKDEMKPYLDYVIGKYGEDFIKLYE